MSKDQVWKIIIFSILTTQRKLFFRTFPDWKTTKKISILFKTA